MLPVLVMCCTLLLGHILFFLSTTNVTAIACTSNIIELIVTSVSTTSSFSLLVSFTILDLTILEFIMWTTNFKKIN
jgi:hypothetical protein